MSILDCIFLSGRQKKRVILVAACICACACLIWYGKTKVELEILQIKLASANTLEQKMGILRKMAEADAASISYLFRATDLASDSCGCYDAELRRLLQVQCERHPEEFAKVILDRSRPRIVRWYAINTVRGGQVERFYDAVVDVLNSKDDHTLRIQAMLVVRDWTSISIEEFRRCESGLIAFLHDGTRPTNRAQAIQMLGEIRSKKAVPYLVKLLDDTAVYSRSHFDDGTIQDNTIALFAHRALTEIVDQGVEPKREIWEE